MLTRTLALRIQTLAGSYPVVFLTGPRQSGKTTLARIAFPSFEYVSLEDLQNREEATIDPRGFLRRLSSSKGVILDEAQRAPDLFSYLQGRVDEPSACPFILTGSQHFLLSERISQSLAGRAAILELLPFSAAEISGRAALTPDELADPSKVPTARPEMGRDEILFTGCFPPIHDRKLDPATWHDAYIRTYVERDVRLLSNIGDLDAFSRFVTLCAGRSGQLLNATALGADAGVSHATARRWLSVLRESYIIDIVSPHHDNLRKRLVKSPKLYFVDTGLMCHLLGIRQPEQLRAHPLRGAIFETFVASELRKVFLHNGQPSRLFFYRDAQGREVDLILDLGATRLPIEVKAGETIYQEAFSNIELYCKLTKGESGVLVYGGEEAVPRGHCLVRPWWACS